MFSARNFQIQVSIVFLLLRNMLFLYFKTYRQSVHFLAFSAPLQNLFLNPTHQFIVGQYIQKQVLNYSGQIFFTSSILKYVMFCVQHFIKISSIIIFYAHFKLKIDSNKISFNYRFIKLAQSCFTSRQLSITIFNINNNILIYQIILIHLFYSNITNKLLIKSIMGIITFT